VPKKATNSIEIIKDVVSNCIYKDGVIDVYSIKTTRFFDLLELKIFKPIVDWNCIYEVFFDEMPKNSQTKYLAKNQVGPVAKKIDEKLMSLPWKIVILMPLPPYDIGQSKIKITNNINAIKIDKDTLKLYQNDCDNYSPYSNFLNYFQSPSKNLKEGDAFLQISTRGFAGRLFGFITHSIDPVYLFKIYIALHLVYGNINTKSTSESARKLNILVYSDNNALLCSPRPEELDFVNNLVFNKTDNSFELINSVFRHLTNRRLYKTVKKLGVQIQNSLFWFFESQKTNNHNLKTIFYVSSIDSFFKQDDTKELKISKIIAEISNTVQHEIFVADNLSDLYNARNKIVHGERQLFDYLVEARTTRNKDKARNEVAVTRIYYDFIAKNILKFEKSYDISAKKDDRLQKRTIT
jgi:hypothetical protein